MSANTLYLRLEGPLQSWGDQQSRFVVRRTAEAPSKSGVAGILCAALGVSRYEAPKEWLPRLRELRMGVRIDAPGVRWWDYHTIGARLRMRTAEGKSKQDALLTRREYLCDASFLVALQGDPAVIDRLTKAVSKPVWGPYLGRKSCPPSRPLLDHAGDTFPDLLSALKAVDWRPRFKGDNPPSEVQCMCDWLPSAGKSVVPSDALVLYDDPLTFDPQSHGPRVVVRSSLRVGSPEGVQVSKEPTQHRTPSPPRPRADYQNTLYRKARAARLDSDHHLCVLCKNVATTVQHITYRRAGGGENQEDLRSLCRLCHDAVTMVEYGAGMGLDRIDPEDPAYRDRIIHKRKEIIQFRSMELRRRHLAGEDVE